MEVLWTSDEAVAAAGGRLQGEWTATGISIDSRNLVPGDLFVALAGPNHDGHDYVEDAFGRGAAAALVERKPLEMPAGKPLFIVPNCLQALIGLGRAACVRAESIRTIGVTGSVGKTGTKSMLSAALAPSGKVTASARSLNNHIGVPLTLARIPSDARYAVIEIGMNAPGEIAELVKLVPLDVALITEIAPAHLEAFDSLFGVAKAKAEIFSGLRAGGSAILPADCVGADILRRAAEEASAAEILTFGQRAGADARLLRAVPRGAATAVRTLLCGEEIAYRIGAPGRHLAMNSLAALLALRALGADLARGCCAFAHWSVPDRRGTREEVYLDSISNFLLVDDSYNANPASMRAALERLAGEEPGPGRDGRMGRRIAFLGDMLELGANENGFHTELAGLDAMRSIDLVFACGPRMRNLFDALPIHRRGGWKPTARELARRAPHVVRPGDVAMVKGSKALGVYEVADALRRTGHLGR